MNNFTRQSIIKLQDIPELNKMGILEIELTKKGLINHNYTVKTLSGTVHARINNPKVLGIDRVNESWVLERISDLNIAPKTLTINVKDGYLITEFINSSTWSQQDCYRFQPLLIKTLNKVHQINCQQQLPRFLTRLEHYEQQSLQAFSKKDQHDYLAIKNALVDLGFFEYSQLLHFDLNASNLIGKKKLTIIDWEFAGCGHPLFDLAIFIHANQLDLQKCQPIIDHCATFNHGEEILMLGIQLAAYMIQLWEGKG